MYKLVHKIPTIKILPHEKLKAKAPNDWTSMWRRELKMDRDVLPIFTDVKYRLQHNGLKFRIKHRYHTTDVNCIHGCNQQETGKHIFWECHIATFIWEKYLRLSEGKIKSQIKWENIVYLSGIEIEQSFQKQYGRYNIIRGINVVRCVIIGILWRLRNNAIYNQEKGTFEAANKEVKCYIGMHFKRLQYQIEKP